MTHAFRQRVFPTALLWQLLIIGLPLPDHVKAQHPKYDTYTGFAVDTTPILPVSEKHPSLYFSADFVETLRARKDDTNSRYYVLWQRFRADARRYVTKEMSSQDENHRPRAAKTLAFWWLMEEDTTALQKAIEALLVAYDGVPQTGEKPYDEIYRATWLQNYAAAYDWVYEHLSLEQNTEIRHRLADETQYLRDNLMVGQRLAPRPHNHRSKPAWAIATAALTLSDHENAADWLSHALEAANTVTRYQFSADGIYREGGHYWMYNAVNFIPFLWQYLNVAGVDLFAAYRPAFEWPIRIRTGRGQIPNIEDSYLKPAPTHMVAAAYRGMPTALNPEADFAAICQWNYKTSRLVSQDYTGATVDVTWEIDEYILFDSTIPSVAPTASPTQFLEGGQVVFRDSWDAGPNDRYLLFHGVAEADNHNHPDQLSFFVGGRDAILVPDAGYGPSGFSDDRRNSWYLTAKSHNIVTADGYPPVTDHLLRAPYVFNVTPPSRYEIDARFFGFAEKESGYLRPDDVRLRRAIGFVDQDYFVVADLVSGTQQHTYRAYLHGRGAFELNGHYASWSPFENRYGAAARLDAFVFPESADITDAIGYVSLFKDERYERYVELTQTGQEAAFLQVLLPVEQDAAPAEVADLSTDAYVAARVTRTDTSDFYLLQTNSEFQSLDDFSTDATFAWMRIQGDNWQQLAVREAQSFVGGGVEFTSELAVTLAMDASVSGILELAVPDLQQGTSIGVAYPHAEAVHNVRVNGQSVAFTINQGRVLIGLSPTGLEARPSFVSTKRFQSYPNPFDLHVTLVAPAGHPGPFSVDVFNLLGQRVRRLSGQRAAGGEVTRITWDGRTEFGTDAPSGVYLVRGTDALGTKITGRVIRKR